VQVPMTLEQVSFADKLETSKKNFRGVFSSPGVMRLNMITKEMDLAVSDR
jgi:hypothetical protein